MDIYSLFMVAVISISAIVVLANRQYLAKSRPEGVSAPWWVDFAATSFSVLLPIFAIRSFWAEPFRIPSVSMLPNLEIGDYILVDRHAYGLRLPVSNTKIVETGSPHRGDIALFRFPLNRSEIFIKRIIGLPGDHVAYRDKRLFLNGIPFNVTTDGQYYDAAKTHYSQKFREDNGQYAYSILNDRSVTPDIPVDRVKPHANMASCKYKTNSVECVVPANHYFVLGDNRDQSLDSRFWGFVPDADLVGKAAYLLFHATDVIPPKGLTFTRTGEIQPSR